MLTITIREEESFDDENQEFVDTKTTTLDLEHSLVSLSKWESEFEKPFLGEGEKTTEEILAYIQCMVITPGVSPDVLLKLSADNIKAINDYIDSKRSATWFSEQPVTRRSPETITSELIYYWMISWSIPFECQHWHLNRLLTLIRVCNAKNQKPKKQTRAEMIASRAQLNAQRRAELNSNG